MIENTSKRDPLLNLALYGFGDVNRAAEEDERNGQSQLVHSERLPAKVNFGTDEEFEALGFSFGEPDPNDPLFRPASMPDGWKKQRTDHAMWSLIVDGKGRERARIFYKADFWDRDAFMSLSTINGKLSDLLYSAGEPVVDDLYTREAWVEALTAERDRLLESAKEQDSYYPKGAEKDRHRARRCDYLLATLEES
jgi:hypothetical protein